MLATGQKVSEMPGHGVVIMADQDTPSPRGERQDLRIGNTLERCRLGGLNINERLARSMPLSTTALKLASA